MRELVLANLTTDLLTSFHKREQTHSGKQVNRSFPGAVPFFPSLQAAFRIFLGLKRNCSGVRRGCGVKVNSLGFQMPQRPSRRPFVQGPERNTLITGWTILDTILGIAKKHVYKGL